jgi:hypothetical protein
MDFTPAKIGPQPDHTPDWRAPPEPAIGDDPSINPPPPPLRPADPTAAHVHSVLAGMLALIESLAAQVPTAHAIGGQVNNVKLSLETLWAMAHNPK